MLLNVMSLNEILQLQDVALLQDVVFEASFANDKRCRRNLRMVRGTTLLLKFLLSIVHVRFI